MIKFVQLVDLNLDELSGSLFITGFQGFGLVGYLSTRHIIRELRLEKIGFIKTRYLPEVTLYTRDYGLQYPFEVYAGKIQSRPIVVVLHNSTPVERERTLYSEFLALFAKQLQVDEVVLVGGLSQELREDPTERYRWIPINDTHIEVLSNAKILEEKHVIGPLALTMMFMQAHRLRGVVILPFTEPFRPDPRASAIAVEVISQILGVKIDVQKLMEEAALIEAIEAEREKMEKAIEEAEKKTRLTYI